MGLERFTSGRQLLDAMWHRVNTLVAGFYRGNLGLGLEASGHEF